MQKLIVLVFVLAAVHGAAQEARWINPGGSPYLAAVGGNYLVTGDGSGLIKLWNRAGPTFVKTLAGHDLPLNALHVSADGTTLVSIGEGLRRKIWSLPDGANYEHWMSRFDSTAYQARSNRVVTLGRSSQLTFWDVATRSTVGALTVDGVLGIPIFSPADDDLMVFAGASAQLYRLSTGERREFRPRAASALHNLAFSPDGSLLAMDVHQSEQDTNQNSVLLWNVESGAIAKTLRGADGRVRMAMSPNNRWLATTPGDYNVVFWDLQTEAVARVEQAASNQAVVFLNNDEALIGGRVINIATGESQNILTGNGGHFLAFSPDGALLAGTTRVWESATGRAVAELNPSATLQAASVNPLRRGPTPIRFAGDNQELTIGHRIFSLATGDQISSVPAGFPLVLARDWYATAAAHDSPNIAELRRYSDGSILRTLQFQNATSTWAIGVSPSERLIATARTQMPSERTMRLWNAVNGEYLRTFSNAVSLPHKLTFSSDERLLAAASEEGGAEVGVWEVATGRQIFSTPPAWGVPAMAFDFMPGSDFLVWGHQGLEIWDLRASKRVARLEYETHQVTAVAVAPDGTSIAVGRMDGTVLLLAAPPLDRLNVETLNIGPVLRFYMRNGVAYILEWSSDLRTWNTVASVTGDGTVFERALLAGGTRFYRLR